MDLELNGVEMRLPGAAAPLFRIGSLRIPHGSQILIEGPSGKGKTTLLHLLSGQFPPTAGRIRAGEHVLTEMDADARCRLRRAHFGIVFQRINLIGHLTVLENALLGQRGESAQRERAMAALERLGLAGFAARRAAFLSPGEQQRVAVARIVARPPDILLADEPTSSLDAANARTVMEALSGAATGKTFIVVSHDPRARDHFEDVRDFAALAAPAAA